MSHAWFKEEFGFVEGAWRFAGGDGKAVRQALEWDAKTRKLRRKTDGKLWHVGEFGTPSVAELRERLAAARARLEAARPGWKSSTAKPTL